MPREGGKQVQLCTSNASRQFCVPASFFATACHLLLLLHQNTVYLTRVLLVLWLPQRDGNFSPWLHHPREECSCLEHTRPCLPCAEHAKDVVELDWLLTLVLVIVSQMSRQVGVFANVLDKAAEKDEQDWECFIAEKEHLVKYILQVGCSRPLILQPIG